MSLKVSALETRHQKAGGSTQTFQNEHLSLWRDLVYNCNSNILDHFDLDVSKREGKLINFVQDAPVPRTLPRVRYSGSGDLHRWDEIFPGWMFGPTRSGELSETHSSGSLLRTPIRWRKLLKAEDQNTRSFAPEQPKTKHQDQNTRTKIALWKLSFSPLPVGVDLTIVQRIFPWPALAKWAELRQGKEVF